VFEQDPDITSEDEVLNRAYAIVKADQGNKFARYKFNYDEDFPSDIVSNYFYLKKQGVAEASDWSNLGAEYRSTKPGTKEPTHTGEKEYFKGGVRHTKDFNREVSHTAATGEKRGRGRPKKSQFESHNTIDRLIAEAFGDDDNKEHNELNRALQQITKNKRN
jgi:hypothetical protein